MISEYVIKYIIGRADRENVNKVVLLLTRNLLARYREDLVNHILDIITGKPIVKKEDVDEQYINDNLSKFITNYENLDVIDFKIEAVDNIECDVVCSYRAKQKIDLDRDDISYVEYHTYISFISDKKVLKKS